LIVRPEVVVIHEEFSGAALRELSFRIHPCRGPPAVLL
jgi:hypothetical protein